MNSKKYVLNLILKAISQNLTTEVLSSTPKTRSKVYIARTFGLPRKHCITSISYSRVFHLLWKVMVLDSLTENVVQLLETIWFAQLAGKLGRGVGATSTYHYNYQLLILYTWWWLYMIGWPLIGWFLRRPFSFKNGKGCNVDVYNNDYRNDQTHMMMILEPGIIVASNDNGW